MPARRPTSTHRGCHIQHNHPLPKGLACLCCRSRKVRCDGATPACSTCIRSAKYEGRDPSTVHCEYGRKKRQSSADSIAESEHEEIPAATSTAPMFVLPVPSTLADVTAEPAAMEQDFHALTELLRKQLEQSRPTTSKPEPQSSYDSGYSSDAYSSDSNYGSISSSSLTHSPLFSFDDPATSYFDVLPQATSADACLLPTSAAFTTPSLNMPAFDFNFSQGPTLQTLPAYGDYFTQSPQDFSLAAPAPLEQDLIQDPLFFSNEDWLAPAQLDQASLEPSWDSWAIQPSWTPYVA